MLGIEICLPCLINLYEGNIARSEAIATRAADFTGNTSAAQGDPCFRLRLYKLLVKFMLKLRDPGLIALQLYAGKLLME